MNNCLYCGGQCKNKFCSLEHYRKSVVEGSYDSSMKGKKHSNEFKEYMSINSIGSKNPNFGNKNKNLHTDEFKEKQRINMLKNIDLLVKSRVGIKLNLSEEERKRRIDHILNVNKKGFENKGGRTKFYNFNNELFQGRYELYFYSFNGNKHNKCHKQFKTPFGNYTPDFELDNVYYEIKSKYTFEKCIKSSQINKIKWFRLNVSKLIIVILDEKTVYEYLKEFNLKQNETVINVSLNNV